MSRRYPTNHHPRFCRCCGSVLDLNKFKRGLGPEGYTTTCLECYGDAYRESMAAREPQEPEPEPPEPREDLDDEVLRRLRQNREDVLGG